MNRKNALLGTVFGIINQVITIFLSFAVRTVLLKTLHEDYVGINALLTDIFGVLIALDFGVSSSIFFKIYRPVASGDERGTKSVFALVRIVYRIRAAIVFVIGFIVYFFLPLLIKESALPLAYIQKCYIIYLVLNSCNYWFIFYNFFLETIQKRFVLSVIQSVAFIAQSVVNILVLVLWQNYFLYLASTLIFQLCISIASRMAGMRYYPYLKGKLTIDKKDLAGLGNLAGMGFHTMSSVVIRFTDSILITSIAGLGINGIYSNYRMIIDKVNGLIGQMTSSVKDPMRNIMAQGDCRHVKQVMAKIDFLYFWISGVCSVCICVLINPFIELIWGKRYVLGMSSVLLSAIVLYLPILNYSVNDAYYFTQCFIHDKKTPIIEIAVNLAVSVAAGNLAGINGILAGTVCCYIVQTVRRSDRLYKKYFLEENREYIKNWIFYNIIIIFSILLACSMAQVLVRNKSVCGLFLRAFLAMGVSNSVYYIIYRKSEKFVYFKSMLIQTASKIWRKMDAKVK